MLLRCFWTQHHHRRGQDYSNANALPRDELQIYTWCVFVQTWSVFFLDLDAFLSTDEVRLKKNLNASRPSKHPTQRKKCCCTDR